MQHQPAAGREPHPTAGQHVGGAGVEPSSPCDERRERARRVRGVGTTRHLGEELRSAHRDLRDPVGGVDDGDGRTRVAFGVGDTGDQLPADPAGQQTETDPRETRPVSDLLKLPASELGSAIGQPATALLAPPGQEQIPAVGDGTLTEPGRYLVMCSIPTGVDPAAYLKAAAEAGGKQPQVAGGSPHFTAGMLAELTVR